MKEPDNEQWYTRPVFFVSDVSKSLEFYCGLLGFKKDTEYQENGRPIVAQVSRGEKCELLLAEFKERAGSSRIYIELWPGELITLRNEIQRKGIPCENTSWGTPVINIKDPDNNEIMFPLEQE